MLNSLIFCSYEGPNFNLTHTFLKHYIGLNRFRDIFSKQETREKRQKKRAKLKMIMKGHGSVGITSVLTM